MGFVDTERACQNLLQLRHWEEAGDDEEEEEEEVIGVASLIKVHSETQQSTDFKCLQNSCLVRIDSGL